MSEGSLPVFEHEFWMRRCLALAERGWGKVSPNPMVGAVLVRDGVVLAEGWHDVFGGAHAERMLFEGLELGGVLALGGGTEDFSDCILYVSLEPCAHFGKTPPCANLILEKGVGRVVVGVLDPNPKVSGRGVEILRAAGVEVMVGVLEEACRQLNWAFWVNQRLGRAAVVVKWAETADGFMGSGTSDRVKISGAVAGDWVMELRRGMDAILVGVDTWDLDQPKLDVRGLEVDCQPVRIVLDRTGRGEYTVEDLGRSEGELWVIGGDLNLSELLKWLYEAHGLGVILVEGGAKVLESFFEADCVDEVHVLRNAAMVLGDGVKSPRIGNLEMRRADDLGLDERWVWERDLG
jgi:diaminohydroxyphosphoribosylaminopyrimidine deaminase / 5-amino-6-(5-phosphoribosylamino)uracil reductase